HLAGSIDRKRKSICGLYILYPTVRTPFNCHLLGLVDEINLTMKRRFPVGGNIGKFPEKRNILRFQRITSCTEQVKSLTVHKENGFLTFVNNQLCCCIEILAGMFPDESAVIAFILNNIDNLRHFSLSSSMSKSNIILIMLQLDIK